MSGAGKVVCVTGASGYVASWLVKLLLQRHYTVNATVRNLSDPSKIAHLVELEGSKERLHLFQANLNEEGSFDSAIDGCECVFHAASPVLFSITNPQQWYCLSKTLAEKAAWEFANENGIDLVVMNPGLVIGPLLQPTLNSTSEMILNIIKEGKIEYPELHVVDIKDVALAHILAMENPSASGRYCLVERVIPASDVLKISQKLYPHLNHLEIIAKDGHNVNPRPNQVSQEKAKCLGISFTPLEDSLKDIVESLKEKNFLSF